MITFIKNEFIKVKSEKFIIIVILLSLIPFVMNLANFLINNQNLSLVGGFYFRFYNQYFM
ncbi:ABC transporter permease, partial [Staphylococcus gallinarum]